MTQQILIPVALAIVITGCLGCSHRTGAVPRLTAPAAQRTGAVTLPAERRKPVLPKRPALPSSEMAVRLKPLTPQAVGLRPTGGVGDAAILRLEPEATAGITTEQVPELPPAGVAAPALPNAGDEMMASGDSEAPPTPLVSTVPMPVGEPGPPLMSVESEEALVGPGQQTQVMPHAPMLPVATDNYMTVGGEGRGPQPERKEEAMPVDAPGEPLQPVTAKETPPFRTM